MDYGTMDQRIDSLVLTDSYASINTRWKNVCKISLLPNVDQNVD